MKNSIVFLFVIAFSFITTAQSIHSFKALTIDGDTLDFSNFKGKKLLIVNTASECGLTPQYKKLQELHEQFKDSGLVIIGFPSNDFLEQDPGTNKEIEEFCTKNYGVSFQMMSKIVVVGESKNEIYKFLTEKKQNNFSDNEVKWNFQKYLLNEEGILEKVLSPKTQPDDPQIFDWIRDKN